MNANIKPTILVVLNYARSGGTVLSQALQSSHDTVLFSEISHLVGVTPDHKAAPPVDAIKMQALKWYGLDLSSTTFVDVLLEASLSCQQEGKTLILRDWTYQSFRSTQYNAQNPPRRFKILDILEEYFTVKKFAFVRNAIDVYLSSGGSIGGFSNDYLVYVSRLVDIKIPVFHYEDFVRNPYQVLARIQDATAVSWTINPISLSQEKVTGDVQLGSLSRGFRVGNLAVLPRKRVSKKSIRAINSCSELVAANRMLGYSGSYWDESVEHPATYISRRVYEAVKKFT